MASANEARRSAPEGFEGEMTGLGLADLVQLGVQNRFSGCICVESGRGNGLIFLREGEIVHAEQGPRSGERAFREILKWPAGRFSLQRNVSSTRSTIHKGWQHLILEAHQAIDEERAGLRSEPPAEPEPAGDRPGVLERLRQLPGVSGVVLQHVHGSPLGDDSYEAEVLAGRALYLSVVGRQLGTIFGAGELVAAAVEGERQHLLLFSANSHFLGILAGADSPLRAVETEVRRVLAGDR
jgi:predicted regulator of Ras-like GTPase activity (Roadblock/LC7/MglB family)